MNTKQTVFAATVGLIALHTICHFVYIPFNAVLCLSSYWIIYVGAHMGLGQQAEETMSKSDAAKFPIVGSMFLFSMFLAFKYLDKYYVNLVFSGYFFIIGVAALGSTLAPIFATFLSSKPVIVWKTEKKITLPGAVCGVIYLATKHAAANNIFGIAFSIQAVSMLSLGSFQTGALLLVGLFFYDIYWVFFNDAMVTVATFLEAPIKLLFVRQFATAQSSAQYSMLGLGDIVIPGAFLALLLRYDAYRNHIKLADYVPDAIAKKNDDDAAAAAAAKAGNGKAKGPITADGVTATATLAPWVHLSMLPDFPKTYFNIGCIFYVGGLAVTVAIMFLFESAQPALLYLVPACLVASLGTAVAMGELMKLWQYQEEEQKPAEAAPSKTTEAHPASTEPEVLNQ